jgi:hypothetical protein
MQKQAKQPLPAPAKPERKKKLAAALKRNMTRRKTAAKGKGQ